MLPQPRLPPSRGFYRGAGRGDATGKGSATTTLHEQIALSGDFFFVSQSVAGSLTEMPGTRVDGRVFAQKST